MDNKKKGLFGLVAASLAAAVFFLTGRAGASPPGEQPAIEITSLTWG